MKGVIFSDRPKVANGVLDIGGGWSPVPEATHMVDVQTKEELSSSLKVSGAKKTLYVTPSVNVIQKGLPYPTGSFKKVISRGAAGLWFWDEGLALEIYRVLRKGGKVDIQVGDYRDRAELVAGSLKEVGFKGVTITHRKKPKRELRPGDYLGYFVKGVK